MLKDLEAAAPKRIDTSHALPRTRSELVLAVFAVCDIDGDGRLKSSEMFAFAVQTGFEGDEAEWANEFELLCVESGADAKTGLDRANFIQLVDDESENGCYCTDEELRNMLKDLPAPAVKRADVPVKTPHTPVSRAADATSSSRAAPSSRADLTFAVFSICDSDGDSRLKCSEMFAFAVQTGFDGDEADWLNEFELMCAESGADAKTGLVFSQFLQLVDDESENGCYCSNDELRDILSTMERAGKSSEASVSKSSVPEADASLSASSSTLEASGRSGMIQRVFRACDEDDDGFLSVFEMLTFARLTGFEDDDASWREEFNLICSDYDVDRALGINLALFTKLVNDESDSGQYCDDDLLKEVIAKAIERQNHPPALAPAPAKALPPEGPPPPPPRPAAAEAVQASSDDDNVWQDVGAAASTNAGCDLSRAGLIREVFRLCDRDSNGRLTVFEMKTFALEVGFDGEDQDWIEEFNTLCKHKGVLPLQGLPPEHFAELIDDESDEGCHCTDEELSAIIKTLTKSDAAADHNVLQHQSSQMEDEPPGGQPVDAAGRGASSEFQSELRADITERLFTMFDSNQDGRLTWSEVRQALSSVCGDTDGSFVAQYRTWSVREGNADAVSAVSLDLFTSIVDDELDAGTYCTEGELLDAIENGPQPLHPDSGTGKADSTTREGPWDDWVVVPPEVTTMPQDAATAADHSPSEVPNLAQKTAASRASPPSTRADLARAVFNACDTNGDDLLDKREMQAFAKQIGFDGDDEAWSEEFAELCKEHGCASAAAVDKDLFLRLVDDRSDSGCYCTDGELREMLTHLFARVKARASIPPPPPPVRPASAQPPSAGESSHPSLAAQRAPSFPGRPREAERPRTRQEFVRAVFAVSDIDGDSQLNSAEMRRFASLVGFQGDDQEWAEEFAALLESGPSSATRSIRFDHFATLVEDESEDGCYCTDEELASILERLESEQEGLQRLRSGAGVAAGTSPPGLAAPPGLDAPPPAAVDHRGAATHGGRRQPPTQQPPPPETTSGTWVPNLQASRSAASGGKGGGRASGGKGAGEDAGAAWQSGGDDWWASGWADGSWQEGRSWQAGDWNGSGGWNDQADWNSSAKGSQPRRRGQQS